MVLQEAIEHAREVAEGCAAGNKECAYQHDKLADWLEELKKVKDILGSDYNLDRLRDLVEADRDGRCTVFPCKPSDVTVYQLRSKKHARGIGVSPRHVYCATVWAGGHYQLEHQGAEPCRDRDFGKTWFLDEGSANVALKGEKDRGL